jgi:hypothetical protein
MCWSEAILRADLVPVQRSSGRRSAGPFLDEIRRAALAGLRSSALPTASTPASMASKPVFFRSRLLKAWTV